MDVFKAQKKKSEITEDDYADIEKDIQTLTDRYIKEVDTLGAAKRKGTYRGLSIVKLKNMRIFWRTREVGNT